MRVFRRLSQFSLSASVVALGAAFATPALAQPEQTQVQAQQANTVQACATVTDPAKHAACIQSKATQAPPAAAQDQGQIVVTGSRIARRENQTASPIQVISSKDIEARGFQTVAQALNEQPSFGVPGASPVGFNQSGFGAGQSFVDFLGLGSQRTLTLVNGRRFVSSNTSSIFGPTGEGGSQVDLNVIPTKLVDRIETVAAIGAPIYGADAIAGTINVILKRDYQGFDLDGQNGFSTRGDAPDHRIRALAGHNFADGRGNITLHGEYAHEDRVYASDVPFLQRVNGFLIIENDPASAVFNHGSDGFPDRIFFRDIRGANININSQIAFTQRTGEPGGPQCGLGIGPGNTPYNCVFFFSADGQSLTQQTGTRVGAGPIGSFIGGNGPTNREEIGRASCRERV